MNRLQQVELNILKEFIKVCKELNLKYYLVCGSALGAVKYKGFIPWDDDIDVALPRKDYEVFISKAQELLPDWCFVQNYHTEKYFHLLGTKLRDKRTTYVEYMCEKLDITHGVFIDVFPLDGYYYDKKDQEKQKKLRFKYEAVRSLRLCYKRFFSRNIKYIRRNTYYLLFKLFGLYGNTSKYIGRFDDFLKKADLETSDIWCNHANSSSEREYANRDQYGDGIDAVFEGLTVRIPEKFDEYLTQKYNDWRVDLPLDQQKGHHYPVIMDLDHPYSDYVVRKAAGTIRIKKSD